MGKLDPPLIYDLVTVGLWSFIIVISLVGSQTPSTLLQQAKLSTSSTSGVPPVAPIQPPSDVASDLATEVDPELAHYLNRNYWTGRAAAADSDSFIGGFSPSAPAFPPPVNPDYAPSVTDPSVLFNFVVSSFLPLAFLSLKSLQ